MPATTRSMQGNTINSHTPDGSTNEGGIEVDQVQPAGGPLPAENADSPTVNSNPIGQFLGQIGRAFTPARVPPAPPTVLGEVGTPPLESAGDAAMPVNVRIGF